MTAAPPIGIQLYTVRNQLKDDFVEVLRKLAEMGYQGVEFAGIYGGMAPSELADFLAGLGLRTCGMHVSLDDLLDKDSQAYAYARGLRSRYVTTSQAGAVENDWSSTVEKIGQAGAVAEEMGFTLTYHNHDAEFRKIDGEYALDILYSRTNPATVRAELDTYWIKAGGVDPQEYIVRFPGRMPQLHIKDMAADDGRFIEIGNGILDIHALCTAAIKVGAEWIIYEQDTCDNSPLESARISLQKLKNSLLQA